MTIAKRLYLLIIFVGVTMTLLAGLGIFQINRVFTAANYSTVNTVPSLIELDKALVCFLDIRKLFWQSLASQDTELKKVAQKSIADDHVKITEALNKYEKEDLSDDKDKAMLDEDRKVFNDYSVMIHSALALDNNGNGADAQVLVFKNRALIDKMLAAIDNHRQYNL